MARLLAACEADPSNVGGSGHEAGFVYRYAQGRDFKGSGGRTSISTVASSGWWTPKVGGTHSYPLTGPARQVLESLPRAAEYVLPGRDGGPRKEIRRPIERIRKAAGLPEGFRPLHGLRHTFASMLASSGEVDLYALQKLLTHKNHAVTERYAHLRDAALRQASGVVEKVIADTGRQTKVRHLQSND